MSISFSGHQNTGAGSEIDNPEGGQLHHLLQVLQASDQGAFQELPA
jgi:hypothetical protein